MDSEVFIKGTVGPCGMGVWYAPEGVLCTADGVRAAGVFLGHHELELKDSGGIYLGISYDAMSDAYAEGTGVVFSMCQGLGIPCTMVCDDMSWGDGYAGYAAMLGVRKSLGLFLLRVNSLGDVTSASASGLCALRDAGFRVGIHSVVDAWDAEVYASWARVLVSYFGFDVPVWVSAPELDAVRGDVLICDLAREVSSLGRECLLRVPALLRGCISPFKSVVDGLVVEAVSEGSAVFFWDRDSMTRVEAGDIDAVVSEASRAVSVSSQDRFRDMESRLSRRERRAARRQLARDRKKVNQ